MRISHVIDHSRIPAYATFISSNKSYQDKYFPGTIPGHYTPDYQNETISVSYNMASSDIVELYSSDEFFRPSPSIHCYTIDYHNYDFPSDPYNNCQVTEIKRLVSISVLSATSNAGIEARIDNNPLVTPSYYRYPVPLIPDDYDIRPVRWTISCNAEYMDIFPSRLSRTLFDDDAPGFDYSYYFSPGCPIASNSTRIQYNTTGVCFYAVPKDESYTLVYPVQLLLEYQTINILTQLRRPQYIK